ncbi:MAG: GNAT family N-acetyltransferase [Pseudomonadota bacterium]
MTASIVLLTGADLEAQLPGLAETLRACVHEGGNLGFLLPCPLAETEAFFRDQVFPEVRAGKRLLWAAVQDGEAVGTVQMITAMPPSQPHRADIVKLVVHPKARRQGLANRLMAALEEGARQRGKTLLTLDTLSDSPAQPFYEGLGFQVTGKVPGFCLDVSGEELVPTTFMYKHLV